MAKSPSQSAITLAFATIGAAIALFAFPMGLTGFGALMTVVTLLWVVRATVQVVKQPRTRRG